MEAQMRAPLLLLLAAHVPAIVLSGTRTPLAEGAATYLRPGPTLLEQPPRRGSLARLSLLTLVGTDAVGSRSATGRGMVRRAARREPPPADARAVPQATDRGALGCGEVAECADRCGRGCPAGIRKVACLYDCKNQCRSKGCASAQRAFDVLTTCIALRCFTSCASGPSPKCSECTDTKCEADTRSCKKHRCHP
jgi:hypothetical protein